MAQRDRNNLIAPNHSASKYICSSWSWLSRIGGMVSHRFMIYFVPHLDPTLGKVGDTVPPVDCCRLWLSAPPAGETHTEGGWALSSLQPCRMRILSAYLCENCLNTVTLPTCISPASSNVKQETQPPNPNTRQVAWKMKINFPIQKPCASVIENLSLSEWELLSSLLVICFCFSFLVEKFSRVFFKLSSLAKHWLKLKRELGVGSEAALDLFLGGGAGCWHSENKTKHLKLLALYFSNASFRNRLSRY